ncbi:unnamed protein product [Porites evermanni]|uniref:QRICH1-like domain-containing protein n=1 Tax=Porites evermanni TaxID=104178 RepID=A0ABN8RIC7_9CNID|nr:unnamed protein product [Porites evermanni]
MNCRFRPPKSVQEEDSLLVQSKPKSTQYKDKWAVFRTWQAAREQKFCILDAGSMFKDYDVHRVQSLEEKLDDLDSLSLNYCLTKFVQEVANKNGGRYPSRSLYGIVCGFERYLEDVNGGNNFYEIYDLLLFRFAIFRRCLDAEMKDENVNSKQ